MPEYAALRHPPLLLSMFGLLLALLVGCSSAPNALPPELTSLAAPAVENEEGLLVVDATAFQANQPRGEHSWQLQRDAEATGGTEMAALRDLHVTLDRQVEQTSPRLDYRIQFVKAGTHYVWVHGQAAAQTSLNGDSLHVGLNGRVASSAKRITGLTQTYSWVNQTMAGRAATVRIPKPGTYTLNVWMREDGAQFDALALTTDAQFIPNDANLPTETVAVPGAPETSYEPTPRTAPYIPTVKPNPAAFSATTLRESVGVAVHATYDDTAYYDTDRVLEYLKELGVLWIRDGIKRSPQPYYLDFLREVEDAGVNITLIVGDPTGRDGQFGTGEQAKLVNTLRTTYAGRFNQLEGPNEWDATGRANWQNELKDFYAAYRTAIRSEPSLNRVRFIGGPLAQGFNFGTYIDNNQEAATLHPYSGGEMPEQGFLDSQLAKAKSSAGSDKPIVATELGYHNAVNMVGSGHVGVSEDVAAHYIIRQLVFNFYKGISQSYVYQLFDQKPTNPQRDNMEEWFGLVAVEGNPNANLTTWTLRKKPAFGAVARLQQYLHDSGDSAAPTALPFEAVNLPQNAVLIPIARKDGSYDIAVWLKNRLWNTATHSAVTDTSAAVVFRFGSAVKVSSYRPSVSGAVTQVSSNKAEVSVPVDGKVTFFRINP